ncbi:MAG: diacylglycerol kinase [Hyphomicrobiales bacterium]|nr:diacylglycerol kinase [Hyphomicrobiales bacterium]
MGAIVAAFWNTCAGLSHAVRTERAVRQETLVLLMAVPLAYLVGAGPWQRVALVASVLLVMAVELLNTCIEKLCDHVTPERHPTIKIVKDMGSAAVFCAICVAGLIWLAALAERLAWL